MGIQTSKSAILNIGFMDLEVVGSEFDIQENPYLNSLLTNHNQVTIITKLRQDTAWDEIDNIFYSKNQVVTPFIRFILVLRGGLSKPAITYVTYRDKLLHSDSIAIFWIGAARDINRNPLIDYLNRDTIRMSTAVKYPDIPGMEEYRSNLTKPSTIVNVVNPKISFAQAASTELGYNPAPVSKAKTKAKKQKDNKKNSKNNNSVSSPAPQQKSK